MWRQCLEETYSKLKWLLKPVRVRTMKVDVIPSSSSGIVGDRRIQLEARAEVLWGGRVLHFREISSSWLFQRCWVATVGFKESGFGFGFTRQSGERAWVIVWYGNGPVALGSLHLQVPVSAVAAVILWRHANYASSGRGGAACCSHPQQDSQLGLGTLHTLYGHVDQRLALNCYLIVGCCIFKRLWQMKSCGVAAAHLHIFTIFGTGCIIECLIPETRGQYKSWVYCHVAASFIIVSRSRGRWGRGRWRCGRGDVVFQFAVYS